jgi:WD40 repeat protein
MQVHATPWKTVGRLAFTPDGSALLAACNPGGVALFEPGKTAPARVHRSGWPGPADLDVAPDGAWAVTSNGYGGLYFLRLPHLTQLNPRRPVFGDYVAYASVSPDGAAVLAYHFDSSRPAPYGVALLRVAADFTTAAVWKRATSGWVVHGACFAADGKVILAEKQGWGPNTRCQLVVCDAATGTPVRTVAFRGGAFAQLVASPDGRTACLRFGPRLRVWNLDSPAQAVELGTGRMHFTGVAFHPGAKYLAATSNDETVKVYDAQTWQLAKTFTWDIGRLRSVCFAPDGNRAAVGSDENKVVVWDVDL